MNVSFSPHDCNECSDNCNELYQACYYDELFQMELDTNENNPAWEDDEGVCPLLDSAFDFETWIRGLPSFPSGACNLCEARHADIYARCKENDEFEDDDRYKDEDGNYCYWNAQLGIDIGDMSSFLTVRDTRCQTDATTSPASTQSEKSPRSRRSRSKL